jgi:superfamily II DNA or RNA helicase
VTHNLEIFTKQLLGLSKSPNFEEAKKEWRCTNTCIREGETCLCTHAPIKYNLIYHNDVTGHEIRVGNKCSQDHFGASYDEATWKLEKERKFAENSRKFAAELEFIKVVQAKGNDWEKTFSASMEQLFLNGWSMSVKQLDCWKRLESKYKPKPEVKPLEACQHDFSPITFENKDKEAVQRLAYAAWEQAACKGSLEIATGVGKTYIGLMAMQQHTGSILIVCPKIDLMMQWKSEIESIFPQISDQIGLVGNGYGQYDQKVVIAVVNSIRDKQLKFGLLIMDEMHRYGSEENFQFLQTGEFEKILGLTATTYRQDGAHKELFEYAPLVYKYSQSQAIKGGLLTPFKMINTPVLLTEKETDGYNEASEHIKQHFGMFNNDFDLVQRSVMSGGVMATFAAGLLKAFGRRRTIVLNAASKVTKAAEIITADKEKKTLVFCEYIKTADALVKELKQQGLQAAKYHSHMKQEERRQMLEDFRSGKYNVMISVKSLDEGTNIPDCDQAIVLAGTGVKRQMIQRLGRILRLSPGKEVALVYQLYVPGTKDEDWLNRRG